MRWKISCLLTSFILVIPLCGCGGNLKGNDKEFVGDDTDYEETVWPIEYKATKEIAKVDLFDKSVQVGDTIINIPLSLKQFMKETKAQIAEESLSEEFLMDSDSSETIEMEIEGNPFEISVENFTSDKAELKDCTVNNISLNEETGIYFSKGITVGSSLTELQEAWGEADEEDGSDSDTLAYYYYEYPKSPSELGMIGSGNTSITGNSFDIIVDRNTSRIIEASYNFTHEFNQKQTIKNTLSYENDLTISYKIPLAMRENNLSAMGNIYATVFNIDNIPYIICGDMSAMGLRATDDYTLSREEIEKLPVTDDFLISVLDSKHGPSYVNKEIINNDGETGTVTGYYIEDNKMYCNVAFVYKGYSYTFYYEVFPYEPNEELSDSAVSECYKLINELAETYGLN